MTDILLPVTLDSANRKKDRSVSLKLTTNFEISNPDFSTLDTLAQTIGWMRYRSNEQPEGLPEEPATSNDRKSKAQRQRAVWFLKWKKRSIEEPFDSWYDRQFEAILDKWKEELD